MTVCRAKVHGGRRCPGCSGPAAQARHNSRRRDGRQLRAAVLAYARRSGVANREVAQLAGSPPLTARRWAVEHHLAGPELGVDLRDSDIAHIRDDLARSRGWLDPPVPQLPPSRTAEFTAEATAGWSEEQLEAAIGECLQTNDTHALDALEQLVDARQSADEERRRQAEEYARAAAAEEARRDPWATPTPLTSPGLRTATRLSATQQLRADYECYLDVQWLQAEADCNGQLLTPEARAKGIDSRSLFSGSLSRAARYASWELQSWWGAHGRLTLAAFRHQAFGRDSDAAAAERARTRTFDNVAAW